MARNSTAKRSTRKAGKTKRRTARSNIVRRSRLRAAQSSPAPRPGEVWRRISSFDDYEASNHGRIRRSNGAAGTQEGRILKPRLVRGYLRVDLRRDGSSYNKGVASLVAEAWVGTCPDDWIVTHRDGDREHNAPKNLAYVTRSESVKARLPKTNSQAKLTPDDVREIRHLYREEDWSGADIARAYNISISCALSAAQGKTWTDVA